MTIRNIKLSEFYVSHFKLKDNESFTLTNKRNKDEVARFIFKSGKLVKAISNNIKIKQVTRLLLELPKKDLYYYLNSFNIY